MSRSQQVSVRQTGDTELAMDKVVADAEEEELKLEDWPASAGQQARAAEPASPARPLPTPRPGTPAQDHGLDAQHDPGVIHSVIKTLEQVPVFSGMSKKAKERMLVALESDYRKYKKGDIIVRRGEVGDREKHTQGSGGSLEPPGPLPTHLHTA